MNNQIKLVLITLLTLLVSGGLFWEGAKDFQLPKSDAILSSASPLAEKSQEATPAASAVLGQHSTNPTSRPSGKVTKVVDGDTIEVEIDKQLKKVRLIGVNTPETVDPRRPVQCFGKEASAETKRLLEGKVVYLDKDVSETDQFGRLLRFIYLPIENNALLFVNDYLVRQGFAYASTYPPDVKFSTQFKEAENEAREKSLGLWKTC